jgi:predicted nucleic acid-binding protein
VIGLTLDAGALIAMEKGNARVAGLIHRSISEGLTVSVPTVVIAQVWRGGPRQALLAGFLARAKLDIVGYGLEDAKAVGRRIAECGHTDVVDVFTVLHANAHGHAVVTSDPEDIGRIGPLIEPILV